MALLESELSRRDQVGNASAGITLSEFVSGDPVAFQRTYPKLLRFAKRFTTPQDAEDLVQIALARAVGPLKRKAPDAFVGIGGNVEPYIKRTIVNTRISQVRSEQGLVSEAGERTWMSSRTDL